MSNEESYKAIIRYLTNEREPYAPGTEGNVKRKIRKAAACYVVRRGTLYYQKKRKDKDQFDELQVVLEADARRELIASFHRSPEGFHLTRDQTWKNISQTYWWRGIFKQVKDYIRECIQCKERVDRNRSLSTDTMEILLGIDTPTIGDSNETDDELSNSEGRLNTVPRSTRKKTVPKQELVFVDSKGLVKRKSEKHSQKVLEQLNLQRLSNQFCDVTLLIEGEEYKAHKSTLAASSEYFRELFIEKGAVSSHEAVVDLSGFSKTSFLPLLEFAYTSILAFDFCHMADVATLARHLLMNEVLEICEHVHKQLEERKITVYQKGDIKMVNSGDNIGEIDVNMDVNVSEQQGAENIENTEGSITIVLPVEIPVPPEAASSNMEDMITNEAVTYESKAIEQIEELNIQPSEDALECPTEDCSDSTDNLNDSVSPPLKRKRGRPPKFNDSHNPGNSVPVASSSKCLLDDSYKSRLRQRTLGEGGYIRLHKGTEKKLRARKSNLKSATQQVAQKLVKRGRKMQPKRTPIEGDDADTEHKCGECGKVFPKRYTLMMHMMKHNRSKEFKCPLCEKEFLYKASLLAHLLRHKRNIEQIDESSGGKTKRQFICDICGKTLPKPYNLRLHMLKHTGVKPHMCKLCGKTFGYKHSLRLHLAHHEGKREFSCDVCGKSFATKRSLQEHTSVHTGESKYLCSTCGKFFKRASGLSKHLKRHLPKPEIRSFQCTQCERSFYEARDLQQHMYKHLGVKPFQCQFCGKCYSWKKDWYSHVKAHSVTEPYKCTVCGKEFFEKALFRRHVKKATHGKKGRAKQILDRTCEHCGKKFSQLREYRRHMNNHQGVKPFECLTCGVAWADARSLKRHVRTHTGERPYVCPVCNDAYIDARSLRKHMTKFHKEHVPGKIMLEKDTLQFHNQGTQVEHAIRILTGEMQEELDKTEIIGEEIETVIVTGETVETVEAVEAVEILPSLTDHGIMQVVNYVLSQQQGPKLTEIGETVEVEVAHIGEVE
uniref:Zinc finger and BTB domain containing 11 n=1 Tax=Callorhinchus milii TaxID=7868 RepID=A0A4W3JY12_CALMI